MAGTIAPPAACSAARCRCRRCPRAGNAAAEPRSSSRRPIIRSARGPRRHKPNRSADDGNCNRPGGIGYAGRSRSSHALRCGAVAAPHWHNRDSGMKAGTNISWAGCDHAPKKLTGSAQWNRRFGKNATVWEISHGLGGSAARVLWTMKTRAGTFFDSAGMRESSGVEAGPLPLPAGGVWGKGPN